MEIPSIGLGTYLLKGKQCEATVKAALKLGYRHFDTAFMYDNHKDLGKALKSHPREEIFLTTKFVPDLIPNSSQLLHEASDKVIEATVENLSNLALKELQTDYLDLLLIHWPDRKLPLNALLNALYKLQKKGKIKFPGVSNYTVHHLQDALDAGTHPLFNQVEFHPYLYQKQLLEFCQKKHIQLIAFRPFGKGALLQEPLLNTLENQYHKTAAQLILRWLLQKNIVAIPKASTEKHLRENLNVFDFFLSPEDVKSIDNLHRNSRYCNPDWSEFNY